MRHHYDAIIIGAGPAGSTAGLLLARAGWSIALIEKQCFPRRKVCGECISASNLPLLEALGLGAQFDACAGPELRRVAFMQGDYTIAADLPAFEHPKYAWGRALGRETLDTLLLAQARAAGANILQPWTVCSLAGAAGDFVCAVQALDSRETATLRAPLVIAAQGSWERPPWRLSDHGRQRRPGDLLAFKANFCGTTLAAGLLPVISFPGGYGGMVLADRDVLTIACCIRADRLARLRSAAPGISAGQAVGDMLMAECAGVSAVLRRAQRQGPWLAAGPLHPGIHFTAHDSVFRIGNAAGEAHPIIGEGISMAIQSAWILCGHLVRRGASQGSRVSAATQQRLRTLYAVEWRSAFTPRLRLAAVLAHIAMRPSIFRPFRVIRHFPQLLMYAAQFSGKGISVLEAEKVTALVACGAGSRPSFAESPADLRTTA